MSSAYSASCSGWSRLALQVAAVVTGGPKSLIKLTALAASAYVARRPRSDEPAEQPQQHQRLMRCAFPPIRGPAQLRQPRHQLIRHH